MKPRSVSFISIILLLALAAASPAFAAEEAPPAPLLAQDAPDALPGRYIVVFKDGVGPGAVDAAMNGLAGRVLYRYRAALSGFAAALPEPSVEALRHNPNVEYIEVDQEMWASDSQSNATWGLDRIDQRKLPLDGYYNYNLAGSGVNAYIIDTGILFTHSEFGGRAESGYDAVDGGSADDCNGHGTHVAGTVGGATYGVAKGVSLVAVRVLDCSGSGTTAGVIAGVDWVTANFETPAVANMSLGGGASSSLDTAVKNSIAAGVSYAVAAGNGNWIGIAQDACNYSPARVPEAMTIGATNSSDAKASWSNYGNCVDWFAPGVSITSAWYTGSSATNTISGTSMATPHTSGVAALYLEANPAASPADVRSALYDATTKGIVTSSKTTNNHLLYSLIGGTPPPNLPPAAAFTFSCSGRTCNFTDTSTDSDGTIVGWSWTFGDDATSTAQNPSHTYGEAGTYSVGLTVADDDAATGNTSQSVTVSITPPADITLEASGRVVRSFAYADLTWAGATGTYVDVWRNGAKVKTTTNDGAYTDKIGRSVTGDYTYQVCEAGTTTCSNEDSVTF
jgi:subtilisin family serine protease